MTRLAFGTERAPSSVFSDPTPALRILDGLARRIAAGHRQPLARAVGLHKTRNLSVCDATAGWGLDGLVLAALGARVTLVERRSAVAQALRASVQRLQDEPRLRETLMRLELIEADARTVLGGARHWDVVYLDPMYPQTRRRALPGKALQTLRALAGEDADADALLAPALASARRRVVVKRPRRAPPLADRAPDFQVRATQLRFDVYLKLHAGDGPCAD